jgi:hypothetical protein
MTVSLSAKWLVYGPLSGLYFFLGRRFCDFRPGR